MNIADADIGMRVWRDNAKGRRFGEIIRFPNSAYDLVLRVDGVKSEQYAHAKDWNVCDEMSDQTEPKLKACPFCGGEARVEWETGSWAKVGCKRCCGCMEGSTAMSAVSEWNRRAPERVDSGAQVGAETAAE